MSEVLQNEEVIKLYEEDHDKPDLSDALAHYGVLGMKWGHRKDKYKSGVKKARKKWKLVSKTASKRAKAAVKPKPKYASKEDAMRAKDVAYINKHKGEFTTNELNQVMNRIQAEQRISQMAYNQKRSTRVKNSRAFKIIMGATISGLTYAAVNRAMTNDPANKTKTKFMTDFAKGAGVGAAAQIFPAASGDLQRLKKG